MEYVESGNRNLKKAKKAKYDEFYTQYYDIENEVNAYLDFDKDTFRGKTILLPCDDPEWSNFTKYFAQNFERFGIKKLISTSYAPDSKNVKSNYEPTLFESSAPQFDNDKTKTNGKIFTLTRDKNQNGRIDIYDLEWEYLQGDGDFRSDEIKKLRDEADMIITNPPFSLFREFLAWIVEAEKQFLIIGNINVISYKEVFPLIKDNKMWVGCRFNKRINGKNMTFYVPDDCELTGTEVGIDSDGRKEISVAGTGWLTNIDHGRRHQPLILMTMADNIRYSKHKEIRGIGYQKYDNYDAIEVPYTIGIPSDYEGAMGVPVSYLDKHCPEQFEIIALGIVGSIEFSCNKKMEILDKYGKPTGKFTKNAKGTLYRIYNPEIDKSPAFKDCETGELYSSIYARIIIKKKQG